MKSDKSKVCNFFRYLSLTALGFLAACGGGGGGDSGSDPATEQKATQQGVFLDAQVQGVSYSTGGTSGTTDENGNFTYKPGDTITFKIGDIELGTVTAMPIITPLVLTGASAITDQRVINMVRFLLTLDDDGDPDNGIQITEAVRSAASGQTINFNMTPSTFGSNADVINALSVMVNGARSLVDQSAAQAHFNNTITVMQKSLSGDYSGTFSGGNSGTWRITVDENGNITGNGKSDSTGSFDISGKLDSSGRGAFGAGGSSDFIGLFTMNGCFAGKWVDFGVSPSTRGTFSGIKSGASVSDCSAISAVVPDIGNDDLGNDNGGDASANTVSGSVNISGEDAALVGTKFAPKYNISSVDGIVIGGIFSNIDISDLSVLNPSSGKIDFIAMTALFSPEDNSPLSIILAKSTIAAESDSVLYSYGTEDCQASGICDGISLDRTTMTITFTDVELPASDDPDNQATGSIVLNGSITFTVPQ